MNGTLVRERRIYCNRIKMHPIIYHNWDMRLPDPIMSHYTYFITRVLGYML